jgi:hypothetical protein
LMYNQCICYRSFGFIYFTSIRPRAAIDAMLPTAAEGGGGVGLPAVAEAAANGLPTAAAKQLNHPSG